MKRLIAFAFATVVVIAGAIGVQAFATSSGDEENKQPPASGSTEDAAPSDGIPGDGKDDDGDRDGFTEDHQGKPGENK